MRSGLQNEATRSKPPGPMQGPQGQPVSSATTGDLTFSEQGRTAADSERRCDEGRQRRDRVSEAHKPNSPRGSEPIPQLPTDESRSLTERNHPAGCRLRLGIFRKC